MSNEETKLEEQVQQSVAKLLEHCDSVRIFVTYHKGEDSTTGGYTSGGGNLYAQHGHVREWMLIQDQLARQEAIRRDEE